MNTHQQPITGRQTPTSPRKPNPERTRVQGIRHLVSEGCITEGEANEFIRARTPLEHVQQAARPVGTYGREDDPSPTA